MKTSACLSIFLAGFFVFSSSNAVENINFTDLTTKSFSLPLGALELTQAWLKNPDNGEDVMMGHISFQQIKGSQNSCSQIR